MSQEEPSIELYSWGPAWDLPTCDPFCLSIETYLSFSDIPWQVRECSNPSISPTGELPLLKDGAVVKTGTADIIAHLKKRGEDLDHHLTTHQRAESQAFITLIEERLHNALVHFPFSSPHFPYYKPAKNHNKQLYTWWLETENFTKSTRPAFSRVLSWTSRYYVPSQIQSNAQSRLGHYGMVMENGKSVSEVRLEPEIQMMDKECEF
ncbi:hypothetical protein HK097_001183 [Rhizophlyctis rosea]|uniref:Mitochondrial outer membrane transport complex Sam37/metaxin N-terminal domain-containing protein n=1 Tax=Rhizophlyctis rosea TaxID=64517 RepID=A0AAD5S4R8_9FUNG|nr:hypothetical protein HK097_001183 [Rhizophlyctis rosea]